VDAEGLRNPLIFDLGECLLQSLDFLDRLHVILETYNQGDLIDEESRRMAAVLPAMLDRFGKLLCDLAGVIGNTQRHNEENESISSSLITNESGISNGSGLRPPMQIPVMPPPAELASMTPRIGPDFDIHIHAFFALRNFDQESRNTFWDNFT
jgi:hypothetical protein